MSRATLLVCLVALLVLATGSGGSLSAGQVADGIYSVRVDGSGLRHLSRVPGLQESGPVWSPSGSKIAFLAGRTGEVDVFRRLYLMRPDGSGQKPLTPASMVAGRLDDPPAWSPDGSKIAFSARAAANTGLWTVMPGHRPRPLIKGGFSPAWSPGGGSIAYHTRYGLRVVSVATGRDRFLVSGGDLPAWSPNGRSIAFTRSGDLWVIAARGGRPRRVFNGRHGELTPPSWSPDGKKILVADWVPAIYLVDVAGATAEVLGKGDLPSWSPNGRQIAFIRDLGLFVMRNDGTGAVEVWSDRPSIIDSIPQWSPDGQRLLFAAVPS